MIWESIPYNSTWDPLGKLIQGFCKVSGSGAGAGSSSRTFSGG